MWLLRFFSSKPVKTPVNNNDLECLKHEIRNAVIGIHEERQERRRLLARFANDFQKSYDRTGKCLERIENCLKSTPIPEDALQ